MRKLVVIAVFFLLFGCNTKKEINYYKNGKIEFIVSLKDGKRDGESITYYEDGKKKLVSNWKNGFKNGESINYFKNGAIKIREFYNEEGKADGISEVYDSLTNLIEKYTIVDGKEEGPFFQFYQTGELHVEGTFKKGKVFGKVTEYFKDGSILKKIFYDENAQIFYYKSFDSTGRHYSSKLPISIKKIGKNEFKIKLEFTDLDTARIAIALGNLDEKNYLKDSLASFRSDSLSLTFTVSKNIKTVSGILYEIKVPDQKVTAEYFFRYTGER